MKITVPKTFADRVFRRFICLVNTDLQIQQEPPAAFYQEVSADTCDPHHLANNPRHRSVGRRRPLRRRDMLWRPAAGRHDAHNRAVDLEIGLRHVIIAVRSTSRGILWRLF